jgi:glucose-6-phosphate dehydrogenase assembly protein OpcA
LLAAFYDSPAYQPLLDRVDTVRIDFIAPESSPAALAPQALLMAGWLASRLGWTLFDGKPTATDTATLRFNFSIKDQDRSPNVREGSSGGAISLEFHRCEPAAGKPGRLVQVVLQSNSGKAASFKVSRSEDNLHLTTEARVGSDVQRGRVLPVRNRSAAQLLAREMEILCNDQIYQDTLFVAAGMLGRRKSTLG